MAYRGFDFSVNNLRRYIGGLTCGTLLTTVASVPVVVVFMDNHDSTRLPDIVIPGFIIFAMGFTVGYCWTNSAIRRACGTESVVYSTSASAQAPSESSLAAPFLSQADDNSTSAVVIESDGNNAADNV